MDKLEILPTDNKIVIIGLAASGKTTLSEEIANMCPSHNLIHSDDYIHFGFEASLYKMISDIKRLGEEPMIVEGVQGFRLLRKGLENRDFFPDLVINCICDPAERFKRYAAREGNNGKDPSSFDKTLYTIWQKYNQLLDFNRSEDGPDDFKTPRFLNITTDKNENVS